MAALLVSVLVFAPIGCAKGPALNPPGPPWINGVVTPQFAVAEGDSVTVHTPRGESLTWRVSDDLTRAHANPDPAYRWLSVQVTNQGKSGSLLLVPRSQ